MTPRQVAIVPHTHWDREWYSPFQTFRLRLVDLLDEFLPRLEADPSYARFMLDGQMAVVDDYLAVRPEAEAVLRRLAGSGRLAMGPWYTLPDEFLVSGETLVRDLQIGMERAAAFGGAMPVGYLPDMFGHVAQMPQLLRQAGFENAVVWRGVPKSIDRSGFWWEAPDGSSVRAEFLWGGYGNGEYVPDDAKALVARIAALEAEIGDGLVGGMLFMNGTDHQVPQPWLGRVVAEANDIQDDYRLVVTSLAEYLATAPVEELPAWRGELRSGARANLLMGVASNRVDVKRAAARAERELERRAEPLAALFLPPDRPVDGLLREAWMQLVRNAAHDSVCACSADDVVDAVLVRYAEARHIAEGITERAIDALALGMATDGWVVVNSAGRTRDGLVELDVPGEGDLEGTQLLFQRPASLGDVTVPADEAAAMLGAMRSQQIGRHTFVNRVDVEETDDLLDVVLHADNRLRTNLLMEEVRSDILGRLAGRPELPVRLRVEQPPSRRVLARIADVPGFGWATWWPSVLDVPPVTAAGPAILGNGLIEVAVDTTSGTFSINGQAGFDLLVDSGDAGDTYNYSPPDDDVVIDTPAAVEAEVVEAGPLRGRIALRRTFTWPERLEGRGRAGEREVAVVTTIEVRAGEPLARITTTFDNACRDHRLRAHFPLPDPAATSRAECAFAVVERGLEAEGGPSERALPTFPSRRFVQAGGLTVVHEGLLEYELVDVRDGQAHQLALTLLRATGMLSRVEMTYRPLPAGPPIPLRGPQMLGPVEVRYALCVAPEASPYALVDDAFLPLPVAVTHGGGDLPARGSALSVEGAEVSALRRVAGGLELRVFNPAPSPTIVRIDGRRGWLTDLRGRPLEPFDGAFPLRPWGIATAHLAEE